MNRNHYAKSRRHCADEDSAVTIFGHVIHFRTAWESLLILTDYNLSLHDGAGPQQISREKQGSAVQR